MYINLRNQYELMGVTAKLGYKRKIEYICSGMRYSVTWDCIYNFFSCCIFLFLPQNYNTRRVIHQYIIQPLGIPNMIDQSGSLIDVSVSSEGKPSGLVTRL